MDYISNFISQYGALFAQGTVDTLVMTLASTLFAYHYRRAARRASGHHGQRRPVAPARP